MVGNAASKYKLQVVGYSRIAGDSIIGRHNIKGMAFTTHDNDNDLYGTNCARSYKGGWWHNSYTQSNLNIYQHDVGAPWTAVIWHTFTGSTCSLTFVEMKLRARG